VSHATLDQLKELAAKQINRPRHWTVIHNSLNGDFKRLPDGEAKTLLQKAGIDSMTPFVLHVGSALPRKNRKLLVRMLALLDKRWHGNVCFAGEAMEEPLLVLARSLSLEDRIVSVVKPDHDTLTALYNLCEAFIFPSFSEGFGWPLLEAQACGAPVIASNIAPLAEISAGTALHADPDKPQQFAEALLSLQDDMTRSTLIRKGFRNTLRFDSVAMASAYLDLYEIRKNKLNECVA
jgi:glycosyltransferase involved in cell wall biosynthesis